jgi:hypothetical protein
MDFIQPTTSELTIVDCTTVSYYFMNNQSIILKEHLQAKQSAF